MLNYCHNEYRKQSQTDKIKREQEEGIKLGEFINKKKEHKMLIYYVKQQ